MASPPPPDPPEKHGFFHKAKDSLRRVKGSKKPPDTSAQSSGLLSLSSSSFRLFPRSRPTTPTPGTRLLLSDSDESPANPSPKPPPDVTISASAADIKVHKDPGNAAWGRLGKSLHNLEKSTRLIPTLNSALSTFIGCLDVVQVAASNREDYEQLADELTSMADAINQYAGELGSGSSNTSIASIIQSIEDQIAGIQQQQERSTLGHILDATKSQEDVISRYRQIEKLFRQIQCQVTLRIGSGVQEQLETSLLRGMLPVDDARYNSSYSTTIKRRACTAETREKIHKDIQDWVMDPDSPKIYWMNGMAGTGKTTIAYSLCEWLERTNHLGASFFCSRISSTCRSLNRIVPTLAYQLARYSNAFLSTLCASLKDNRDAGTLNVVQQFEYLIHQPVLKAKDAIPDSVVLVIDALDECDDNYSVRLLLDVLLKFAEQLPLKFFVSSRPEPLIRDRMMSQRGSSRSIVYLHDIEQSIVEEDIKKYLTEALSPMVPPPPPRQIELLAKRSRNLFIYAATVVRYIYPEDVHVDSNGRLKSMLATISDTKAIAENKYEDLDRLYTTVLKAVFNKRLDSTEKQRMQNVLWTVVCAREPMTVATIALLASLDEGQVWVALQSLRSVVHVPEDNSLISTLHASFPEYMLNQSRSKRFHCNESKSNEALSHRCFEVMKSELKFNICALESSYLTNDQIYNLEAQVTRCISPSLSYACRYWGSHLLVAPALNRTVDMFLDFLCNRLLFWMEVLSLGRFIGIGAPMLQQVQTWLRQINSDNQDEIQKQVSDACNFVTWFGANPCSQSTPHIYISALPLCAKSSWVYKHYFQHTTGLANISMSKHDETVLAIWSVESPVLSLAISPKGDHIATGSQNGSMQVYDMHTGAVVAGPFRGHTKEVNSVAFSPSGTHIASCSDDKTIIIWDSQTGRMATGPLHGHTRLVLSVAFSPDGKHLVSGSFDQTAIVWDTSTGAVVLGPLKGHSNAIYSVGFSPDGQLIASGSQDHTIRIWNASTGAAAAEPFVGHKHVVTGIAFSSDGSKLASCSSDKTIRVWDMESGTSGMPFEGHKGKIFSIAFSYDNAHVVSGGDTGDCSIMVWDTLTGSVALGPLSGHTQAVRSVEFSPDNTRLVSCSRDQTIRIWDVNTKHRVSGQQSQHELSVGPVSFLPDRTQFISNSSSGVLRAWDMKTGIMSVQHEFEGQLALKTIHCLTISFGGTLIAVSSSSPGIRVWRIPTGKIVSEPVIPLKSLATCLVFSPDGSQLCSGSDSATIIVWDVEAGTMVGQPYEGHTGQVLSVTYSPDGTHIASGTTDRTVMIWDSSTGGLVHTLNGHKDSVSSVAFSLDGNFVVSGSVDGIIRKWEVATGVCSGALFEPHHNPLSSLHSNRSTPVNSVSISPDGTQVISGFGSSIRLVDAHTTKLISDLSLPRNERIRWVGYSPDGADIISISVSEVDAQESDEESDEESDKESDEELTQQSPQGNIIRVWRAVARSDQQASPSTSRKWSYEYDGRVMSPEGFVIWVPPDLIPYIEAHTKLGSESHYSPLALSADGFINIGYTDLCIGNRWTECYASKD